MEIIRQNYTQYKTKQIHKIIQNEEKNRRIKVKNTRQIKIKTKDKSSGEKDK